MAPKATSEATQATAQEPVAQVQPATTPASEAPPATVQELPPSGTTPAETAAPEIDIEAVLSHPKLQERLEAERRKFQSQKDREVQQERLRIYQEAQEQLRLERERQHTAAMDNEDYGAWVREQDQKEQERADDRRKFDQQRQQWIAINNEAALSIVKDAKAREALEQRNNAGEFKTYPDFVAAAHEIQAAVVAERAGDKRAREAREAAEKGATARLAGTAAPDLATGQPTGSTPTFKKPIDRMRWALDHPAKT